MKLADWAKKQGIAYLTAYRWFKDGKLPVKAYQSDSGTIIVEDNESSGQSMGNNLNSQNNDVFSLVLKKVVEYSKNNSTIEDFAAYILSNFSLKLNPIQESPRYSKNKPKPEDIQKYFQQFIPKGEKPKPNMFVTEPDNLDNLVNQDEIKACSNVNANLSDIRCEAAETVLASSASSSNRSDLYNDLVSAFANKFSKITEMPSYGATGAFKPTQKELDSAKTTFSAETKTPRKRGRKPYKKTGK
jgi:hypothetical protein